MFSKFFQNENYFYLAVDNRELLTIFASIRDSCQKTSNNQVWLLKAVSAQS